MRCEQCGREMPDQAERCVVCGAEIPRPRTSVMAIASPILGVLVITALIGLILGIIALVQIGGSRGKLRGQGLAIAGIAISGFMLVMLLPAMLFPVFVRAREEARSVACQSNLMEIAHAMRMYTADFNGALPQAGNWCDAIRPYHPASQSGGHSGLECPSALGQRLGYAYNIELSGFRMEELRYWPHCPLCFDAPATWNTACRVHLAQARHAGKVNVAFTDGKVESLTPVALEMRTPRIPRTRPGWLRLTR